MFSMEISLGFALCFLFTIIIILINLLLRKTLMENHAVYFICERKGRMFCWLIHHVWKIKCCQTLRWTYFLKKSRLNYIKPQGVLVTVDKSVHSFYYTSRLERPYLPRISLLYYALWVLFNVLVSYYKIFVCLFFFFLFFPICWDFWKLIWNTFRQYFIFVYLYQSLSQNSLNLLKYLYVKGADSDELEKCRGLITSQIVLISLGCWDMVLITKS